jgi:hypothetical protein
VTHPAVLKWEKDKSQIPPTTEKYVRLYAYDQLKAKNDEFRRFFAEISSEKIVKYPKAKVKTITVDAADMRMVA